MPPVVSAVAATLWGDLILGRTVFAGNWTVHLFINFIQPTPYSTVADFTECSWPGYSSFELQAFEWVPAQSTSPTPTWAYPLLTWVFDPSNQPQQTVFGYWVEQAGQLMYAEAFAAPFPIPPEGGQVPINLYWTDEQCAE